MREECLQANLDLVAHDLVDLTFGNVSTFDAERKVFAIKPSGVAYEKMVAADMVIVNLDGELIDGYLNPSSDTSTHRCLYLAFEKMGVVSIAHTHSRNAVAFAQAGMSIPCFGTTHADFFYGDVPITRQLTDSEINGDYEWETGKVIVEAFEEINPKTMPAVLVRNHGPFAWGNSSMNAIENAMALELVAEMALKTLALNPDPKTIEDCLLNKHFNRKHGESKYYGQGDGT